MTATDERSTLDAGALLAALATAEHERDEARAALLAASDAASLASAGRLDAYADGYRAGFLAGEEVGGARAVADYRAARAVEAADVGTFSAADVAADERISRMLADAASQSAATYAALDRLRYPPHGRASWIRPNLGDLYDEWASYDGGREDGR